MIDRANPSLSRVVPILWADVAFELVVCVTALALTMTDSGWLGISHAWLCGIAAAFGAASLAIVPIACTPHVSVVTLLGWANLLGGIAGWLALALYWAHCTIAARWMLAAVMDGFVVLGSVELILVRRELRFRATASSASSRPE
jgi:hypothetical protein